MRNLKKITKYDEAAASLLKSLGLQQTQPGETVYLTSLTPADYFAVPLLSNSGLKGGVMQASPATLRTGSLWHMALLEPHLYTASEERQAYIHDKAPTQIIQPTRLVDRMAAVARKNTVLQHFIQADGVHFESEIYVLLFGWLPVKIKVDIWDQKRGKIADLKSTSANNRPDFIERFDEFGYWNQAALYMETTGADTFYFIGVSKSEPHQCFTVDSSHFKTKIQVARRQLEEKVLLRLKEDPSFILRAYDYILNTAQPF